MRRLLPLLLLLCLGLCACVQPNINVFGSPGGPYREQRLSGTGKGGKILLVSVDGLISEREKSGMLRTRPSTLEDVTAQLRLARRDPNIKAVVLKVDSPGGTVTASDLIAHEITRYKADTGVKVVAVLMGVAASGGYYVALPADHIAALPTTVTGSVGVIFLQPRVAGLLEKIGVSVDVSKSGAQKDMGSPFRQPTEEERRIVDGVVKAQAERFQKLVREHRKLDEAAMATVATARVFTAQEAKELKLVDSVGYMEDVFATAEKLGGLPKGAPVVSYRRQYLQNATPYAPGAEAIEPKPSLVSLGLENLAPPRAGMYYLWLPGSEE